MRCNNGHITEIHTGAGQGTESKVNSALQRRCHIVSIELFHAFPPCVPCLQEFLEIRKRSRSQGSGSASPVMASLSPLHALPKVASDWSAEAGTAPLFSQEPGTVEDFCYEKQYGTVDGRLPIAVGMHLNYRIPSATSTNIESE